MKQLIIVILAIFLMGTLAAESAVMVVGIKNHEDIPRIDSVLIKQGRFNHRCRDIGVFPVPGENRRPLLMVYDSTGTVLYHTAFAFPTARTVPPRQPGEPDNGEPDVIALEQPEVFLVAPVVEGASRVAVYNPGQSEPASVANLDDKMAVSTGLPVPERAVADRLNILIIASGFDASDMNEFNIKARELKDHILAREPFRSFKGNIEVNFHENLLNMDCTVGCGGIPRLICCHSEKVIIAAVNSGYMFDEIIVLHNTDTYSGGGFREISDAYKTNSYSSYAMSYTGSQFKEVALHEFGHSFGNLCDEYTYSSEGYIYNLCVNCRENCGDWKSISETCQASCDSESDYFRPDNSVMLSRSYPDFNDVSIYSKFLPDGLERRVQFFSGVNPLLYIPMDLERLREKAWIIKKDYGKITISFDNPADYGIDKFVIHRKLKSGEFTVLTELMADEFTDGQYIYLDKFLENDKFYIYKIEALDQAGTLIGESDEMGL